MYNLNQLIINMNFIKTKRYLSAFLCVAMLLSTSSVFASTANSSIGLNSYKARTDALLKASDLLIDDQAVRSQITSELEFLSEHHFLVDKLSIQSINDGNIVYAQQTKENLVSFIDVTQTSDGSVYVHIVEDSLENTMHYTPDGKLFVDGQAVTITSSPADQNQSRAGMMSDWYFDGSIPPGTKPEEYVGNGLTIGSSGMINFGVTVGRVTVAGGLAILASAITKNFVAGAWITEGGYLVADTILSLLKKSSQHSVRFL